MQRVPLEFRYITHVRFQLKIGGQMTLPRHRPQPNLSCPKAEADLNTRLSNKESPPARRLRVVASYAPFDGSTLRSWPRVQVGGFELSKDRSGRPLLHDHHHERLCTTTHPAPIQRGGSATMWPRPLYSEPKQPQEAGHRRVWMHPMTVQTPLCIQ